MSKSNIILLNGPSSSGKTTLAKYLQDKLQEPYLLIGIDQMIALMPDKMNDYDGDMQKRDGFYWNTITDSTGNPAVAIQVGHYACQILALYQQVVIQMATLGHNLIIDEVCWATYTVQDWRERLKAFNTICIGFKLPLSVLEERERQRGDRMIGSTRAQYYSVHRDATYDLEYDAPDLDLEQCLQEIHALLYS